MPHQAQQASKAKDESDSEECSLERRCWVKTLHQFTATKWSHWGRLNAELIWRTLLIWFSCPVEDLTLSLPQVNFRVTSVVPRKFFDHIGKHWQLFEFLKFHINAPNVLEFHWGVHKKLVTTNAFVASFGLIPSPEHETSYVNTSIHFLLCPWTHCYGQRMEWMVWMQGYAERQTAVHFHHCGVTMPISWAGMTPNCGSKPEHLEETQARGEHANSPKKDSQLWNRTLTSLLWGPSKQHCHPHIHTFINVYIFEHYTYTYICMHSMHAILPQDWIALFSAFM